MLSERKGDDLGRVIDKTCFDMESGTKDTASSFPLSIIFLTDDRLLPMWTHTDITLTTVHCARQLSRRFIVCRLSLSEITKLLCLLADAAYSYYVHTALGSVDSG